MPAIRPWLLASLVGLALAGGGCGGAGQAAHRASSASHGAAPGGASGPPAGALTLPTPAPTGAPPDRAAVAVIRAWADALRRGDVHLAATYFALPSVMVNGPDASGHALVVNIASSRDAVAANTGLPCGATLASTDQRGPYVNALFAIGPRSGPGGDCRGQRGTARVNFVIQAGKIVHWLRAPDDPGDQALGPGATPPPSGSAPSPSTGPV